jgi:hypothetical protein
MTDLWSGQVFPQDIGEDEKHKIRRACGLTLLEYFTAHALRGIPAHHSPSSVTDGLINAQARLAVDYAKAALRKLEETK